MTTRSRPFAGLASAILLGSCAGIFAVQSTPLSAAGECLAAPNGAAPKGSHWHYRIDRATKKNCWYVRAETGRAPLTRAAVAEPSPRTETPLQPSVANARAEADTASVKQASAPRPEPAPFAGAENDADTPAASDSGQSTVASRWLDQPPAGTTDNSSAQPNGFAAKPDAANAAPPAAEMHAASSAPAIPPLLLVIVGALAAAGLMAGLIFRFGSVRGDEGQDFEREAPWQAMDVRGSMRSPPLAAEAHGAPASEPHDAPIPPEIAQLLSTISKQAPA